MGVATARPSISVLQTPGASGVLAVGRFDEGSCGREWRPGTPNTPNLRPGVAPWDGSEPLRRVRDYGSVSKQAVKKVRRPWGLRKQKSEKKDSSDAAQQRPYQRLRTCLLPHLLSARRKRRRAKAWRRSPGRFAQACSTPHLMPCPAVASFPARRFCASHCQNAR